MRTKKFAALERRCSDRSDGAGRGGRDLSRPFGRAPADARGQKKAPELSGAFKAAITYSSAFAVPSA